MPNKKSISRLSSVIIISSLIIPFNNCDLQKIEWKGTIEVWDGVTVVNNPKNPIYKDNIISLEEELSIGESNGPEEYIFSNLNQLLVDNKGYIYAMDAKEKHIKVYSDVGKYIQTIGKFGQGPGEIGFLNNVCITPHNELVVTDAKNNRLTIFSMRGELIKSIAQGSLSLLEIKIDSKGNRIGKEIVKEEMNPRYELKKFNSDMQYLCSFDSSPLPNAKNLNPFMSSLKWSINSNDCVVSGYPETYEIKIFDPNGKILKKILKDNEPLEITKEDIKKTEGMPPGVKLSIPKYYPAFRDFIIDDESRIFILTWEKIPDTDEGYFDVFDSEGKYLAKVPLKVRTQVIKKNKLYSIEENDDGFHCIKRYRVTWKIRSVR